MLPCFRGAWRPYISGCRISIALVTKGTKHRKEITLSLPTRCLSSGPERSRGAQGPQTLCPVKREASPGVSADQRFPKCLAFSISPARTERNGKMRDTHIRCVGSAWHDHVQGRRSRSRDHERPRTGVTCCDSGPAPCAPHLISSPAMRLVTVQTSPGPPKDSVRALGPACGSGKSLLSVGCWLWKIRESEMKRIIHDITTQSIPGLLILKEKKCKK